MTALQYEQVKTVYYGILTDTVSSGAWSHRFYLFPIDPPWTCVWCPLVWDGIDFHWWMGLKYSPPPLRSTEHDSNPIKKCWNIFNVFLYAPRVHSLVRHDLVYSRLHGSPAWFRARKAPYLQEDDRKIQAAYHLQSVNNWLVVAV